MSDASGDLKMTQVATGTINRDDLRSEDGKILRMRHFWSVNIQFKVNKVTMQFLDVQHRYFADLGSLVPIENCPPLLTLNGARQVSASLLRLISTQVNFPQDGNRQESFLCLVSSRSELMALTYKGNFPVRSRLEESFPKWKLVWTWARTKDFAHLH